MICTSAHQHRLYRDRISARGLVAFTVAVQETDLFILAAQPLPDQARASILNYRYQLEAYIRQHPPFLTSFSPLPPDPLAPPIIRDMLIAAETAGVGPMAAVAGAFAETVGRDLLQFSDEIVVENGGDLYLKAARDITIGIYAGDSPLSNQLALRIHPDTTPAGVCTSSGTVGHSLSLGKSDAAIVIAPSTPLADAAATALGNRIKTADDIPAALEFAQEIGELSGVILIKGDKIGLWGDANLVPTEKS